MNIESLIVDFFNNIGNFPFDLVIKIVALVFVVFWIMVSGWVYLDARERTQSLGFRLLSSVFVLIFSLPGLLIYMIIRPKATLQEQYWADLEKRYLLYETAELFDCPKCAYPLQPGFINCPNCAETIKVKCTGCGVNIDKYWKHCPFCSTINSNARVYKETVTVVEEVNEKAKDVNEQKAQVRKENRLKIGVGLNSVFKQTQSKLALLKEKLAKKKVDNVSKVVEKKTKKAKKKK